MVFLARFQIVNVRPPVKLYIHSAGIAQAFSATSPDQAADLARDYFLREWPYHQRDTEKYDFLLAALWASPESGRMSKIVDCFGFYDIRDWRNGNYNVDIWNIKDGLRVINHAASACEDTMIAFGLESSYRRTTNSLDEFVRGWPNVET